MSDARTEFLDAWQEHDYAAGKFSDRKGRGATTATLKNITDRLVLARAMYCAALCLSPIHAQSVLEAWRRAGFNHERALRALEVGWWEGRDQ